MKPQARLPQPGGALTVGRWLHDELQRRGYNLSQRGGGRRAFADESGIPQATVSRLLRDDGGADPATLGKVAQALNVPLTPLLVLAGIIPEAEVERPTSISTDEALAALGITRPAHKVAVMSMVNALLDETPERGDTSK